MLEALLTRYGLEGWLVTILTVPASDLPHHRAADVEVKATERAAHIRIAEDVPDTLWAIVLEHEIRHVWHWRCGVGWAEWTVSPYTKRLMLQSHRRVAATLQTLRVRCS